MVEKVKMFVLIWLAWRVEVCRVEKELICGVGGLKATPLRRIDEALMTWLLMLEATKELV